MASPMDLRSNDASIIDMERKPDLDDMKLEAQDSQDRASEETSGPEPPTTQQQPAFNPHADFKEGGTRGWLTVVGCWCVMFFTFGYLNAFGIYEAYYLETFLKDESPSAVAWIGSIQIFVQFSGSLISGPVCDRFGPQVCETLWPLAFTDPDLELDCPLPILPSPRSLPYAH